MNSNNIRQRLLENQTLTLDAKVRWRIELSPNSYDIQYRPGKDNVVADTFSRALCTTISTDNLYSLHSALCHPGITRMYHLVRSRNLPYSLNSVKQICKDCKICQEVKPQYFKPEQAKLIKATQPFKRLSIDFKGPLPITKYEVMLTIVDEYLRFPFAYAVKDMTSATGIKCLTQLFAIFGMPSFIHSDRGAPLISKELNQWLFAKGIATVLLQAVQPRITLRATDRLSDITA